MDNLQFGSEGNTTLWIGSEIIGYEYPFHLTGTLEAGILDNTTIPSVNTVLGEHLYSGALAVGAIPGGSPPSGTLMNKASIRGNLSGMYSGMASAHSYGREYYLVR